MKTNRDIKNFVLKHTIYITSFSSSSPKRYQCNSTLSSSFLVLHVHHGTDTDVSFLTQSNEALGFYVLDEASKESKLIAEYRIILKSDGKLSSEERSIIFYRFDASAQSITHSLRISTVECTVKPQ